MPMGMNPGETEQVIKVPLFHNYSMIPSTRDRETPG
jgi:hypothetical protein